jgi:hypothetical protein
MVNEAIYTVTQECIIELPDLGIEVTDEINGKNWKEITIGCLQECWEQQGNFLPPNDGYAPARDGKLKGINIETSDGCEIRITITQWIDGEAYALFLYPYVKDGYAAPRKAWFNLNDSNRWYWNEMKQFSNDSSQQN